MKAALLPTLGIIVASYLPVNQALARDSSKAEYLHALKTIERFERLPYRSIPLPQISRQGYRTAEDTLQISEEDITKEGKKRKWQIPSWDNLTAILPKSPGRYKRRSINDGENPFDGLNDDEIEQVDFDNVINEK